MSPLVDSFLTIVSEAQKQIGVNRAAVLLENTIIDLRSAAACAGDCLPGCRISVTTDIAPYSLDFFSWCRGYDLSVYMVVADPKVSSVQGFDFNFRFRRTLRASSQVVVRLADPDCSAIYESRPVTAYTSAEQRIEWDVTTRHLFPVLTTQMFPGPPTSFSRARDGRPARPFICGRKNCRTTS